MTKKENKKITKNTNIIDVLEVNPKAFEILLDLGMGCIGCHMAHQETLEQGCLVHGMTKKQIDALIKRLNKK